MGFEIINVLKKEKGWTNEDLSQKSGVPKATIDKVTAGTTSNPSFDTVKAISDALGCDIDIFRDRKSVQEKLETKKAPPSEDEDASNCLYERILMLSPENRAKLSELIDLYLGSQGNK